MTEKEKKLNDAYNKCLVEWGFADDVSDKLPTREDGFLVGEMDEYLCDANFAWYKDKGITESIDYVGLYYDLATDRLKVIAYIDDDKTTVGYIKTTVDDVIRMLTDLDAHKDTDIMIDAVDRFMGVESY